MPHLKFYISSAPVPPPPLLPPATPTPTYDTNLLFLIVKVVIFINLLLLSTDNPCGNKQQKQIQQQNYLVSKRNTFLVINMFYFLY